MFATLIRPLLTVAALTLLVPTAMGVDAITSHQADAKLTGAAAWLGIVVLLLLALLLPGARRPTLTACVLGGLGVTTFAVSTLFGGLGTVLAVVGAVVMLGTALLAVVASSEQARDGQRSLL